MELLDPSIMLALGFTRKVSQGVRAGECWQSEKMHMSFYPDMMKIVHTKELAHDVVIRAVIEWNRSDAVNSLKHKIRRAMIENS